MDYREKSLRDFAVRQDMQFTATDDYGLLRRLRGFRLTDRGNSGTITNILRREDTALEYSAYLFDYSYRDWSTKNAIATRQTALFVESQQLVLPELRLQPETLLHKLGELFGLHDIDFVRFPKFSSQYRLAGDDEDYIRHHFNDEVLNYFTLHKGWSLEGIGYYLVLYKQGMLLPPEELAPLLDRGLEVYRLFREERDRRPVS